MTKVVKGAGRRKYAAQNAKHSQRTPLPARASEGRDIREQHLAALKSALERKSD